MKTDSPAVYLLVDLAECKKGKGLPVSPQAKGYRYCMAQGWIERLGVPGILEITRITLKGRKFLKDLRGGK